MGSPPGVKPTKGKTRIPKSPRPTPTPVVKRGPAQHHSNRSDSPFKPPVSHVKAPRLVTDTQLSSQSTADTTQIPRSPQSRPRGSSMPATPSAKLTSSTAVLAVDDTVIDYSNGPSVMSATGAQALVDKANAHIANGDLAAAKDLLQLGNLLPGEPCLLTLGYSDSSGACNGYLRHIAHELKRRPQDFVVLLDGFHAKESGDDLVRNRKIPKELAGLAIEGFGTTRMEDFYLGYDLILSAMKAAVTKVQACDVKKKQGELFESECGPLIIELAVQLAKGKSLFRELDEKWHIRSEKSTALLAQIVVLETAVLELAGKESKSAGKRLGALTEIVAGFKDLTSSLLPFAKRLQTEPDAPAFLALRQHEEEMLRANTIKRIQFHLAQGKTVVLRASASLLHSGHTGYKTDKPMPSKGLDVLIDQAASKTGGPPTLHLAIPASTTPHLSYGQVVAKSAFGNVQTQNRLISMPPSLFSQ